MTAHSTIGASSMYRWSACPGSVRESAKAPPQTSSVYAEAGSDAHALGAVCLREDAAPGFYIGKQIKDDGRDFTVTEEMADAVYVYVNHVCDTFERGDTMHVEQKFDLSSVHPGCFGTADCVIWQPKTQLLHVIDYKHGAGIAVNVTDNPQLQYYGLGALLSLGYPAKRVRLTIVQPRCDHSDGPVRSWEIDAIDLLDFRADLITYAKATEDPDALLVPGDHCRFCPAAALCPALVKKAQEVAKLEFAPALSYDPAQLKMALDSREPLKAWLKALDEFAYAEAEAGRTPIGYKLVAKTARRAWRSEGEVIDYIQTHPMLDLKEEDIFEPRALKSPAQLEKLDGLKPKTVKKVKSGPLDQFTIAESSGHALVPEDNKRPAIKKDAKSDFGEADLLALGQFARQKSA